MRARTRPLDRVEDIDAHVDQGRQELPAAAVVVVEYPDTEFVTQIDEALVLRCVELEIELHADERARLAPQIVGDLRDIDEPRTGFERPAVIVV